MGKSNATVVSSYTRNSISTVTLRICIMNEFWKDVVDNYQLHKDVQEEIKTLVKNLYYDEVGEPVEMFKINDMFANYNSLNVTYSFREIVLSKDMTLQYIVEDVVRNI